MQASPRRLIDIVILLSILGVLQHFILRFCNLFAIAIRVVYTYYDRSLEKYKSKEFRSWDLGGQDLWLQRSIFLEEHY